MQRLAVFVLATVLLALAIALVTGGRGPRTVAEPSWSATAVAASTSPPPDGPVLALPSAPALLADTDLILPDAQDPDTGAAGTALPDGSTAPNLPSAGPRTVVFGVALVAYVGAQGAGHKARSKDEALVLAKKIALLATTNFGAALELADVGVENAGEIQRGVLEPGPEYVLFELPVGAIGGPVDSPRGYYVFKRIE